MKDQYYMSIYDQIERSGELWQRSADAKERSLVVIINNSKRQLLLRHKIVELELKMDKLQAKLDKIKKDWNVV